MDKKKLHRVEAVEVTRLVQGGPAEMILFIFGAAGIEEELADLLLPVVIHERGFAVAGEIMRIMERYALRSIRTNIPLNWAKPVSSSQTFSQARDIFPLLTVFGGNWRALPLDKRAYMLCCFSAKLALGLLLSCMEVDRFSSNTLKFY